MRNLEEKTIGRSAKRRVFFAFLLLAAIVLALLAGWYFLGKNIGTQEKHSEELAPENELAGEQASSSSDSNAPEGAEESESELPIKLGEERAMASENYKVSQVRFGGDAILSDGSSENLPLEIYDARSETVASKDGEDFKLLIVWKTNKLAASEIEYSESGGQDPKTAAGDGYGFDHSAVLSDLEPATAYVYKIKASDRWGNETASDYFGAYTGKKAESVFELVVKAAEEVFGWAMRK